MFQGESFGKVHDNRAAPPGVSAIVLVCLVTPIGFGSKLKSWAYAGFGLCVHRRVTEWVVTLFGAKASCVGNQGSFQGNSDGNQPLGFDSACGSFASVHGTPSSEGNFQLRHAVPRLVYITDIFGKASRSEIRELSMKAMLRGLFDKLDGTAPSPM